MLPDVIGPDARRHGENRAGTFGGVWTAGETAGLALGTTVLTIVLAVTGYQASVAGEHTTQSGTAVLGIVLSFSIVPAVIVALSLLTLARYPLRRADVEADSDAPDADSDLPDAEAAGAVDGTPLETGPLA
jgi:Na+/melibiose symporter-like transporter